MNFVDSVKTGFDNYVNFEGRATRSEYWWWVLFYYIVYFAAMALDFSLGLGIVSLLASLAMLAPSLSVACRRLHDIGRSGWWQLLVLTIIGIFVLLYWFVQKGDAGENKYGPARI